MTERRAGMTERRAGMTPVKQGFMGRHERERE